MAENGDIYHIQPGWPTRLTAIVFGVFWLGAGMIGYDLVVIVLDLIVNGGQSVPLGLRLMLAPVVAMAVGSYLFAGAILLYMAATGDNVEDERHE